jgi:hypothetical protein
MTMASEPYENLVRALEDFLRDEGRIQEGWALGDWVICLEQVPFAPELANRQRYGYVTPEPTIPLHRLLGLLDIVDTDLRAPDDE